MHTFLPRARPVATAARSSVSTGPAARARRATRAVRGTGDAHRRAAPRKARRVPHAVRLRVAAPLGEPLRGALPRVRSVGAGSRAATALPAPGASNEARGPATSEASVSARPGTHPWRARKGSVPVCLHPDRHRPHLACAMPLPCPFHKTERPRKRREVRA